MFHFFEASSRNWGSSRHGHGVVIMESASSTWCSTHTTVHRLWLRILSVALEEELQVLDRILSVALEEELQVLCLMTTLLFGLLRLFSFVSALLISLVKLSPESFLQEASRGPQGARATGSCSVFPGRLSFLMLNSVPLYAYILHFAFTYSFFKKSTSLPTMVSEGFSEEMTIELNFA